MTAGRRDCVPAFVVCVVCAFTTEHVFVRGGWRSGDPFAAVGNRRSPFARAAAPFAPAALAPVPLFGRGARSTGRSPPSPPVPRPAHWPSDATRASAFGSGPSFGGRYSRGAQVSGCLRSGSSHSYHFIDKLVYMCSAWLLSGVTDHAGSVGSIWVLCSLFWFKFDSKHVCRYCTM